MDKEFIPSAQAQDLFVLNFNEPCFGYWDSAKAKRIILFNAKAWEKRTNRKANVITAPTYQQAFRWFATPDIDSDKWPIETWVKPYLSEEARQFEGFYWSRGDTISVGKFDTNGEAELACLKRLIEIVKEYE